MTYLDYLGERLADHPEAVTAMCRLAHINRQWLGSERIRRQVEDYRAQQVRERQHRQRAKVRRLRAARRARRVLGVRRG